MQLHRTQVFKPTNVVYSGRLNLRRTSRVQHTKWRTFPDTIHGQCIKSNGDQNVHRLLYRMSLFIDEWL